MRSALIEQSNAFVELADKCQAIFKAQGAMMELIPESVDIPFLSEDHQCKSYVILNVFHLAQNSGELLLQNMLAVKTFADWPIYTANQLV